jgi:hypothetical protein
MSEQEGTISNSLRELAGLIGDRGFHDSWVELARKAADLLESPQPPGIPVRIAVATGPDGNSRYVNACGIDAYGDAAYALNDVAGVGDDGRAIVDAVIPASLAPIVKGLTRA